MLDPIAKDAVITTLVKDGDVSDKIARIELASSVTGFIEEFMEVKESFAEILAQIGEEGYKSQFQKSLAQLETLVEVLNSSQGTPFQKLGKVYKSKIQKMGIEAQIVKARENGASIKKICEVYNISSYHVSKFFQIYDGSPISTQKEIRKKSIFDATDRLEELSVVISRQIANLETYDAKNQVLFVREMRETIALAAEISDKIHTAQMLKKMTQVVGEIVLKEVPADRRPAVLSMLADVNEGAFISPVNT